MRRFIAAAAAVATSLGLVAQANEGVDLSARSRSQAAASAVPANAADAPFVPLVRSGRDPMPRLILQEELERRGPRGACEHSASDLCYDLTDARVVYRPARRLMPEVGGLRAESLSLRHDRIVFKYSFR